MSRGNSSSRPLRRLESKTAAVMGALMVTVILTCAGQGEAGRIGSPCRRGPGRGRRLRRALCETCCLCVASGICNSDSKSSQVAKHQRQHRVAPSPSPSTSLAAHPRGKRLLHCLPDAVMSRKTFVATTTVENSYC